MTVRRLERGYGLGQTIMLGTAGAIATSLFVLMGYLAGLMGPASIVVLVVLGFLNLSIALNYAELGTMYPVTGGALTYVREAFGPGLLSFLVGSLDCLSSSFYAALSALGFAFSLRVILPGIPIVPVAIAALAVFTALNVVGGNYVGRAQLLLGGVLLTALAVYVVVGLLSPSGFSMQTFVPEGRFFIYDDMGGNLVGLFSAFPLIFNAFIGFDVIANDAEEVQDPDRNLPRAILISLGLVTVIYAIVALVTLGTVPWQELAGSETALSDAAERFMTGWGGPLIAGAGIVATLTSCNTAMLSATQQALTLGRAGLWPRFMSRLGRLRTPYAAAIVVGAIAALMASVGVVDLLSYISSTGYLFAIFWASLAMVRLRDLYPNAERPFEAPLFPLTPYAAAGVCALTIAFASTTALLFLGSLLLFLILFYYLRRPIGQMLARRAQASEAAQDRITVAIANPETAQGLVELAALLAQRVPGTLINALTVVRTADHPRLSESLNRLISRFARRQRDLLERVAHDLQNRNIPFFVDVRVADTISDGIIEDLAENADTRLLLMGWPGALSPEALAEHPVTTVMDETTVDMAVFLDRGLGSIKRVLVPFGGGIHARLALRLASELAEATEGQVVAYRCFCEAESDDIHDEMLLMREAIETEYGTVPETLDLRVVDTPSLLEGVRQELAREHYDLVVMGAAVAHSLGADLFGVMTDLIAEEIPTSVLLVRRGQAAVVDWLRRRAKAVIPEPASQTAAAPDRDPETFETDVSR